MPSFRLLADYNNDGHLTDTSSDTHARHQRPGAVLVTNVDVDSRGPLPSTVRRPFLTHRQVRRDADRARAEPGDDELILVEVRVAPPQDTPTLVWLRFVSELPPRQFLVYRARDGQRIRPSPHRAYDYPVTIPPQTDRVQLRVGTRALPGVPHRFSMEQIYRRDGRDESQFRIQLITRPSETPPGIRDQGLFSIAPFLCLHSGLPARRIYIARTSESGFEPNSPTIAELDTAVQQITGVELMRIPIPRDTRGQLRSDRVDSWVQDQFAFGATIGPQGPRTMILHFPRLRTDSTLEVNQMNLAVFVREHFPSENVGLVDHFWERTLPIVDANGYHRTLTVSEYALLDVNMRKLKALWRYYQRTLLDLQNRADAAIGHLSWSETRRRLVTLRTELDRALQQSTGNTQWPSERRTRLRAQMEADFRAINEIYPLRGSWIGISLGPSSLARQLSPPAGRPQIGGPLRGFEYIYLTHERVDQLFERLRTTVADANYGGNVMASPPTPSAPLGKVFAGNADIRPPPTLAEQLSAPSGGPQAPPAAPLGDSMDPQLIRFFDHQPQPLVSVDVRWLRVGHVDEVLNFIPDTRRTGHSFVAFRASGALARRILLAALEKHRSGLPSGSGPAPGSGTIRRPGTYTNRLMNRGSAPLTRLLRGKLWLQERSTARDGGWRPQFSPPETFITLALLHMEAAEAQSSESTTITPPFSFNELEPPPPGHLERVFHSADITVEELLYCERSSLSTSTNEELEQRYLRTLGETLERELSDTRIGQLPVIFDRVLSFNHDGFSTSAFTPNVVNLQVLNGHLLVPRPYGPRMRVADAISVMWMALSPDTPENLRFGDFAALAGDDLTFGVLNPLLLLRYATDTNIRRAGLLNGIYWVSPFSPGPIHHGNRGDRLSSDDLLAWFTDSILEDRPLTELTERMSALTAPAGWIRLQIREETVDLFELYMFLVAQALGLELHFIDSWYYHVSDGELHCGTNVLREVDASLTRAWWETLQRGPFSAAQ